MRHSNSWKSKKYSMFTVRVICNENCGKSGYPHKAKNCEVNGFGKVGPATFWPRFSARVQVYIQCGVVKLIEEVEKPQRSTHCESSRARNVHSEVARRKPSLALFVGIQKIHQNDYPERCKCNKESNNLRGLALKAVTHRDSVLEPKVALHWTRRRPW